MKNKYRLELHWDEIQYLNDSQARLKGAYFFGPALKNAAKIEAPDYIDLDLTPQLIKVFGSYYIARLGWEGVDYLSNDKVLLKNTILSNDHLKSLHKFKNGDYIVIDTEKHEEKTHAFHLVYDSTVVREDRKPYKFEED